MAMEGIVDIPLNFDTSEADRTISKFAEKCVRAFDNNPIDPFETLNKDIKITEKNIKELENILSKAADSEVPIRVNPEEIKTAQDELNKLRQMSDDFVIQHPESSWSPEVAAEWKELISKIEEAENKLNDLSTAKKRAFKGSEEEYELKKQLSEEMHVLEALKAKRNELSQSTDKETRAVRESTEAHKQHGNSLIASFAKIAKYAIGIRSLYTLFSRLKSAAKEGLGYAANYCNILRNSMNQLSQSMTMMKAGAGAAVAPLANALAPVVARLAVLFTQAANAVARFFAILTGKRYVVQAKLNLGAYSKAASGAGKATKKAADDVKKALAPFDDLNVLAEDTADSLDDMGDGAGGLGEMGSDMFETIDLDNFDSEFLKKLKEWLDSLDLEPITKAWERFTEALDKFFAVLKAGGMWVLENILFPLGTWLVEKFTPEMLNLLAAAIDAIRISLEKIGEWFKPIWDTYLKPFFESVGDKIIEIIQNLTSGIEELNKSLEEMDAGEFMTTLLGIIFVIGTLWAALKLFIDGLGRTDAKMDETANGPLTNITGKFQSFLDKLGSAAIIASVAFLLQGFADVISSLTELIQVMNDTNTSALDIFWLMIAVLVPLGLAIAALVAFIPPTAALTLIAIAIAVDLLAIAFEKILGAITDLVDRPVRSLIEFIDKIKTDGPDTVQFVKDFKDAINKLTKEIKELAKESEITEKAIEKLRKKFKETADLINSTTIVIHVDTSQVDAAIAKLNQLKALMASVGGSIGGGGGGGGSFSVPGLASGGVLPPNQPFLAMLGDQKSGTNIEAPLDTIVEAMETALGRMNYSRNQEVVLNIDGQELARLTVPNNLEELNRQGYNVRVLESK